MTADDKQPPRASVPEQTARVEERRQPCDTVLTGSRIPKCNRADVKAIARDPLERDGHTHCGTPLPGGLGL